MSASAARLRMPIRTAIDAAPARPVSFRARAGIALATVVVATVSVVVATSSIVYARPAGGLDVTPGVEIHLLSVLCLLALLVASATHLSLTRGRQGLGAPVAVLAFAALAAVPAYAALTVVLPVHAADPPALAAGLSPWGARCLVVAGVVGAIVLVTLSAALHRAVPAAIRWRGGALGAAAGLWSGMAVFVFCPASEQNHLLIGHVAPIAAFMLAGLTLVPRLLKT